MLAAFAGSVYAAKVAVVDWDSRSRRYVAIYRHNKRPTKYRTASPLRDAQRDARELPMNACLTAGSKSRAQNGRRLIAVGSTLEESMPRKFSSLLRLYVAAALFVPVSASAAALPIELTKPALADGASAIEKAYYRDRHHYHHRHRWHHRHHYHHDRRWHHHGGYGRCRSWRHECASRWGWGGHGFHRCLWRHGC